jgi:hypothetical protein
VYVKFKDPFNFEGETYDGFDMDLDALTGNDLEKAQEIAASQKKIMPNVPEFSKWYCAQVAAFAAKKPVEFIRALPMREYVKVTIGVQNFLLDGVSEMEATQ